MIVLDRTKGEMLAEIHASDRGLANRVEDPSDPAFQSLDEASFVVRGSGRQEILPLITAALARRLEGMAPERFIRNVGRPLKRALGNADKRGNHQDPDKRITVEVVATRTPRSLLRFRCSGER